jgi:hypothetical protein
MNAATEQVDLPATLLLDASVIDDPCPFTLVVTAGR